jgi:hypothetical protein
MKYLHYGIIVLLLLFTGCKGEKDIPRSGTITLTNELFGTSVYYSYGLSFSLGEKVTSLNDPEPDITVEEGIIYGGTVEEAFFSVNTLDPAFALYGTYGTENEAVAAYSALTSFSTMTWVNFGSPLSVNQIWLVRTREDTYAKVRVKEVILDTTNDFASCTFEWAYQPDGTKTFPAK